MSAPQNLRPPSVRYASSRRSEASYLNPYTGATNNVVIPRRGYGQHDWCRTVEGLRHAAYDSPLRLLTLLPDIHPGLGLALWNALRLTCAPGDLKIVAVGGKKGAEAVDEVGTQHLDDLWGSLPNEIGGLTGLQTQLTAQAMLTGLICVEAVPGGRMKGVVDVWPVDSLSIGFRRDPDTSRMVPLQRQLRVTGDKIFNGYTVLPTESFFWRAVDPAIDEPYGRAPYAVAVAEVLTDLAMMKDLRDSVHNAAWPRLAHGFNFVEMYKVAKETFGLVEPEASTWVQDQFNKVVAAVADLKADDNIFYDAAADVKTINSGEGFKSVAPVLEFLRQRIVQSVKSLPTLMGINDGSTQTYTTVEWAIYAAGLESVRSLVVEVLVQAANLHLRLLGLPLKAEAKWQSLRTSDALVDAQTEAAQIANAKERVRLGWDSNEEACVSITGSGPFQDPPEGAFDPPKTDPKDRKDPKDPKGTDDSDDAADAEDQ